ncbi:MAG: PhoU domain-containing protein, partial [archaeon]|nr:PhoU domain-containing protein [archaeon]
MADETYEVDEIVDELLNKKRGIKEIIKEMKNVSELMVDLAYSAILFNNDDLAEEVKGLEEEMNKLRLQIEISAMLAARTSEDASKLSGIIRVAAAAESISNAAEKIADTVLRDIELHPVLKEALEEAEFHGETPAGQLYDTEEEDARFKQQLAAEKIMKRAGLDQGEMNYTFKAMKR